MSCRVLPQQQGSYIWQHQHQQGREGDKNHSMSTAARSTRALSVASSAKEAELMMNGVTATKQAPSVGPPSKPPSQGPTRVSSVEHLEEGLKPRISAKEPATAAGGVQDSTKAAKPPFHRVSSRRGDLGSGDLTQPLLPRIDRQGPDPGPLESGARGWHGTVKPASTTKRPPTTSTAEGVDHDALEQQYEALMAQERDSACYFTRARNKAAPAGPGTTTGRGAAGPSGPPAAVAISIPPPDEVHVWPDGLVGGRLGVPR
jgi:hypothetical protein